MQKRRQQNACIICAQSTVTTITVAMHMLVYLFIAYLYNT